MSDICVSRLRNYFAAFLEKITMRAMLDYLDYAEFMQKT